MADSTLPAQAAIVAALKADAGVTALVGARVYDRAPDDVAFPYVSLGPESAQPFEAQLLDGWDMSLQIDTWSRKTGRVECRQIMAAIYAALHGAALAVSGHALVMVVLQLQTTMDDPDGVTVHGVQRFTVITHA